jgi:hypothetical protein
VTQIPVQLYSCGLWALLVVLGMSAQQLGISTDPLIVNNSPEVMIGMNHLASMLERARADKAHPKPAGALSLREVPYLNGNGWQVQCLYHTLFPSPPPRGHPLAPTPWPSPRASCCFAVLTDREGPCN